MSKKRYFYIKKGSVIVTSCPESQCPNGSFELPKETVFHENWIINTPKDDIGGVKKAIDFFTDFYHGPDHEFKDLYEFKIDEKRFPWFSWFVDSKNVYSRLEEVKS